MATKAGINNSKKEELRKPLIPQDKDAEIHIHKDSDRHEWMVYLSTFVAVCGSYAFGSCVSPEV